MNIKKNSEIFLKPEENTRWINSIMTDYSDNMVLICGK